jgi:hypothetical protein
VFIAAIGVCVQSTVEDIIDGAVSVVGACVWVAVWAGVFAHR